jgi:hypothetical protein
MDEKHWIASWGTAQQLAPAAEAMGGPQMPDDDKPGPDGAARTRQPSRRTGVEALKLARRLTNRAVINMGIAGNRILRETTAWAPPGWPASTATSWRRAGLHARAGGPPPGRQPLDPRKLRV